MEGGEEKCEGSGDDGVSGGSQQIVVRQLADGSLITADGQRLVFSKDDITEIQFSAEGETVMVSTENGINEDQIKEVPTTIAHNESVETQDACDGVSEVEGDTSVDETSIEETSVEDMSTVETNDVEKAVTDENIGDGTVVIEDVTEEVVKQKDDTDGRTRRSGRNRDSVGSRSVVEEIAAGFDEDAPVVAVTPRRGRPRKFDETSVDTTEALHIASPPMRGRPRKQRDDTHVEEVAAVDKEPVPAPRGRGRPRKNEESAVKSDAGLKRAVDSIVIETASVSPLRKRSALASSQENKSLLGTPKKQVRIMDSPNTSSMMSTPRTPASAVMASNMKTPEQVYDFSDEQTPSTSGRKEAETPEVAMNMSIETQTEEPEHIEVIFWESSPGKRTVQTQTDPRLKMKKIKVEDSLFSGEDSPRRRRRRTEDEDDFGLFEDAKRRNSKRTTEEALKCPFCEKSFIGLVKHIKSRHCDEPDYDEEMRNARWRERIMKVSSGALEGPGDACDDCGKVTMNMKRHRESHQMDRMQIPCPMCNKIVLKTGLSSHMRTVHSGRKPYKCPHCDYVSAFRGNLNTHVKGMHLHTRQYLCNVCHAAFKTLGALIGHTKRVHEGWKSPNQKIFICSVCEKRFTKKYHVDRHMLIHTGEKPHKCDDCQRTFNNKSNLMSHIQLVHKRLSPYQCDLCKETFKRKKLLLEHIGRVHVSRGEHIVFRTPMDDADRDDDDAADDSIDSTPVLQEVNQDALFADGNQVQLATVVSVEEAANLTSGQHYTTLQTETGEETIIIVHSGDVNDVAQVIMDQQGGGGEIYSVAE